MSDIGPGANLGSIAAGRGSATYITRKNLVGTCLSVISFVGMRISLWEYHRPPNRGPLITKGPLPRLKGRTGCVSCATT
jgi:hypothetical protein